MASRSSRARRNRSSRASGWGPDLTTIQDHLRKEAAFSAWKKAHDDGDREEAKLAKIYTDLVKEIQARLTPESDRAK
jgi:hypothetical protein